jgi:Ca-activated chloride channel family protein
VGYARLFLRLSAVLLLLSPTTILPQDTSGVQNKLTTRHLHLIITDSKATESLENVQASEISLTEDGVLQPVDSLEMLEMPVHYGLLIDTSRSLRRQFPTIIEASRGLLSANRSKDRTFMLRFVDKIEMVQQATSDKAALANAVSRLKIDPGQTALFDALYVGITELQKVRDPNRRKALVVITDGENRASRIKEGELFKLLREADFKIFIVGLVEELDREGGIMRRSPYEQAVALLDRLAKETGGRVFLARAGPEQQMIDQIVRDLRHQYVLKYRSRNAQNKSTHKVEIKVSDGKDRRKRKAVLRPAYTAQQLLNTEK